MKKFHCSSLNESPISRRSLLRLGGAGMLGLSMPNYLRAKDLSNSKPRVLPKAQSVIFLFQWGGPSQIDILDMKPNAPKEYRSPHSQIRTSCPEIEICEHLPRMAKLMDKCTVVRTVHHKMKIVNMDAMGFSTPQIDSSRKRYFF